jgi:hypothetical protein
LPFPALASSFRPMTEPAAYRNSPASEKEARIAAAAARALAEAEARRAEAQAAPLPIEHGGRDGPEPVRYGDWEKKGLAIDF